MKKPDDDSFIDELTFTISEEDCKRFIRLDHYLVEMMPDYRRNFIKGLYKENLISLANPEDTNRLELKKMPPAGTEIVISIPPPIPVEAKGEDIPLNIIYEDEHLVFVNKPAGMVTHPAPGNYTGTLVNAIIHHCPDLGRIGDKIRPGIVHRLDKGTSGVMVVAKTQACHEKLVVLFSQHNIQRVYNCICLTQNIAVGGTLNSTIGRHPQHRKKMHINVPRGKEATTYYKILKQYSKINLMEMTLETGRTHQIRVHLSQLLKCPVVGDTLYGNPKQQLSILGEEYQQLLGSYEHPLLHAKILGLTHPITGEKLHFDVPLPQIMQETLNIAQKELS
jgi:23S rRNA pseudouridine1911/1915/1917 synthase